MKYLKKFRLFENNAPLLQLENNIDNVLLSKITNLISTGKILEISCGNAADAIELSNRGYNVTATELCDEYIENANMNGINCIKHDTKNVFPFKDSEFSLVYSRLGLHYFNESELSGIFNELYRITSKYLVFTVKLINDIPTGKVIFTENIWKNIVIENFDIISSTVKTGVLYGNNSKWLEIIASK